MAAPVFLPIHGLTGGLIIGVSILWNALLLGRVTGIAGFLRGALPPQRDVEKQMFILGLLVAGLVSRYVGTLPSATLEVAEGVRPWMAGLRMGIGGAAVGIGTSMGNGCTSGHGACGLGRRSPRSVAAVAMFLSTAVLIANVARTVEFWSADATPSLALPGTAFYGVAVPSVLLGLVGPFLVERMHLEKALPPSLLRAAVMGFSGLVLGVGLLVSRMADPGTAAGFLTGTWSPWFNATLVGVFAGAVAVSLAAFRKCRVTAPEQCHHPYSATCAVPRGGRVLDRRLLAGAALFGVGWGLTGFCPGPVVVALGQTAFGDALVWTAFASMAAAYVGWSVANG